MVSILNLLFFINMLLAFLLIFIERRNPSATWAWLLVFLILPPGMGFILYLFLGQNLSKQKIFNKKIIGDKFRKRLIYNKKNRPKKNFNFNDLEVRKYVDMIELHYNNSDSVFSQNNSVEIYTTGEEKFNALFEAIENAKNFIHIQYYIIKPDNLGKKLINELISKAKEGVEIKLLYDAMGGRYIKKGFFDELIKAGGKVAEFFPSIIPHINIRMNYRNHRKIVVVDGQCGFIGGFNVGDEYLGKSLKFGYWRDTHIKISGEAVDDLEERFLLDWSYAAKENITYADEYFPVKLNGGKTGIQIVSSGPDSIEQQVKNGYLKMINSAKKSVYIQTPYFVPDDSIIDALKLAALSGVDVRIMIPSKPDHPFVLWTSYSYIGELLPAGVKVYNYNKGFIHAKTIVVDEIISSVGTANMDIRSFKLNFEINAFLYDHNISTRLKEIFEKDIEDCIELTQEIYENRGVLIKIKESISRLLAPIL